MKTDGRINNGTFYHLETLMIWHGKLVNTIFCLKNWISDSIFLFKNSNIWFQIHFNCVHLRVCFSVCYLWVCVRVHEGLSVSVCACVISDRKYTWGVFHFIQLILSFQYLCAGQCVVNNLTPYMSIWWTKYLWNIKLNIEFTIHYN